MPPSWLSAVADVARVIDSELAAAVVRFAAKHGLTLPRRPSRVTLRNVRTGIASAYGLRRSRVRVALAHDGTMSVTVRHPRGLLRWFALHTRDAVRGARMDAEVHRPRRAS